MLCFSTSAKSTGTTSTSATSSTCYNLVLVPKVLVVPVTTTSSTCYAWQRLAPTMGPQQPPFFRLTIPLQWLPVEIHFLPEPSLPLSVQNNIFLFFIRLTYPLTSGMQITLSISTKNSFLQPNGIQNCTNVIPI